MPSARILLVEDHVGVAFATRSILERRGSYEVIGPATSLAEALALVSEHNPDAMVVDLTLPDARGAQAPQQLRARAGAGVPILVFSAMSGSYDQDAGQHADAVVFKGDHRALLEHLANLLTDAPAA